jgi:hypothetical protein
MEGQIWTINSEHSLSAFLANVRALYDKHHYLTYPKPRIGPDRSLDQNALFHVWATEYAAHLLDKPKKEVTKGELAGMKRIAKQKYYRYSQEPWLIHEIVDPFSGESRRDFTSSKDWKTGEMFNFLTWFQMTAANDGLVLESKGKFSKLQKEAEGRD